MKFPMKKLIPGAVLALTLAIIPVVSPAQTIGDVDTSAQSSCVALQNNLRYRSTDSQTGGEVSLLQDFLNPQYLSSEPTGFFGKATLSAVKNFQAASGLLNSGYVGPYTRAKIKEFSCGDGSSVNPPVAPPTENQTISGPAISVKYPLGGEKFDSSQPITVKVHADTPDGDAYQRYLTFSLVGGRFINSPLGLSDTNTDIPLKGGTSGDYSFAIPTSTIQGYMSPDVSYKVEAKMVIADKAGVRHYTSTSGSFTAYNNQPITQPSATIDQSSLYLSSSGTQTISGTAAGVSSVSISVGAGTNIGYGDKVYGSGYIALPPDGRWSVNINPPLPNGVYTIYVYGYGDGSRLTTGTLTVTANNFTPTLTLTADPAIVISGQSTTLTWTSTNASSCSSTSGTGGLGSNTELSGSNVRWVFNTTTFSITCTGPGGSVIRTVTVTVNQPSSVPTITIISPNGGEGFTLDKTISISWKTTNPGVGSVSIYLRDENNGKEFVLEDNTPNTGFYEAKTDSASVPGIVPDRAYRVIIWWDMSTNYAHNRDVSDKSDTYFKIYSTSASAPVVTINTGSPGTLPISYQNLRPGTYVRVIGVNLPAGMLPITFSGVYAMIADYTNNGITSDTLSGSGQTSIILPATFTAGSYVLELSDPSDGWRIYLRSSPFQIAPVLPTSTPTITIISPNGGGYWYGDKSAVVEWKTSGIPQDNQMLIRLRSMDTNQEYNLTTTVNDGSETITVPTSIPSGGYTLEIKTAVNGQSYIDASDSYFKVIASTSVPIPVPVAGIVGKPTFQLGYDSSSKEASLTAYFTTTISGPLLINKPYASYTQGTASLFSVSLGGTKAAIPNDSKLSVSLVSGYATDKGNYWSVEGGQSAIFLVSQFYNPRLMFAGSYYASLSLLDNTGRDMESANSTNSVTIVGELSPYIDLVAPSPTSPGRYVITGARFNPTSLLEVGGIQKNLSLSDGTNGLTIDGKTITFEPGNFVSSSGVYPVVVIDPTYGRSNKVYADIKIVSTPIQSSATINQSSLNTASAFSAFESATKKAAEAGSRFAHTFFEDLFHGARGSEVAALQYALVLEGLYGGEATGNFYDRTYDAVKRFQEKYGLKATGYVGPATRAKLNELFAK